MDIKSLCYIPLNCRIVLFVYQCNKNELPDTLTQLYETFILHTVKHYADRISPELFQEIEDIQSCDALPSLVQDQIQSLSQMAFLGIQEDKLVFTRDELKELNLFSLGLLTSLFVLTNVSKIKHFQFLHLTIQEFLAAKYLSSGSLSNKKVAEIFRENIFNDRFRMTLLFLAGITKFNFLPPNDTLIKEDDTLQSYSQPKTLFLLQLLYESRNESTRILPLLKANLIMSEYTLSQFDFYVILHTMSQTPAEYAWEEVSLRNCRISKENTTTLLSEKRADNCFLLETVKNLDLRQNVSYAGSHLHTVINFLTTNRLVVKAYFPKIVKAVDCNLVSRLFEVTAKHPTLQHLAFGTRQTLSKKRLIQVHSNAFPIIMLKCIYSSFEVLGFRFAN